MNDEPATSSVAPAERPAGKAGTRPVRVAWVAGANSLESLAPTIQPLAISLMDEMVELCVLCPEGADIRCLPSPPVEMIRFGRGRWGLFGGPRVDELASRLVERKVQLLHALDVSSVRLVWRLAAEAKIDYVVSSYAVGDGKRLGRLGGRARAVLAASYQIQCDLMENRVVSARKAYLLRPGIVRVSGPTCYERPADMPAVVAGGRLDDFDCFDAVLRTFSELKRRNYQCVYIIIGQGRSEKRLRARVESLNLRPDVTFVDPQPPWQFTGILRAADIYISPAPSNAVDFQSLLAMAVGVPVLSVESPASDFLKDGQTTLQFRRGDASGLNMKLLSVLEDRAAARRLAEKALEYLGQQHGPAEASSKTVEIYRRAVAEAAAEKKQQQKA